MVLLLPFLSVCFVFCRLASQSILVPSFHTISIFFSSSIAVRCVSCTLPQSLFLSLSPSMYLSLSLSVFLSLALSYSLFLSLPLFFCPYLSVSSPLSFSVSLPLSLYLSLSVSLGVSLCIFCLFLSVSSMFLQFCLCFYQSVLSAFRCLLYPLQGYISRSPCLSVCLSFSTSLSLFPCILSTCL